MHSDAKAFTSRSKVNPMTGTGLAPYLPKERRENTFDIPFMLETLAANIRAGRVKVETLVLCGSNEDEDIKV